MYNEPNLFVRRDVCVFHNIVRDRAFNPRGDLLSLNDVKTHMVA